MSARGDGLPFVLASMVLWGAVAIPLTAAIRHIPQITTGATMFLTAGTLLLLWRFLVPGAGAPPPFPGAEPLRGLGIAAAGGLCAALALALQLRALELRGISRTVPILNLNTIVAVFGGVLLFQERLSLRGWIGVALAIVGGYLVQTGGK